MVDPDRKKFLKSLASELLSQADRVRNLIGDRHWLSDGSHKEALLANLLRRTLPHAIETSRGFLISASNPRACSKELDILLLDTFSQGPFFNENELIIGTAEQAIAAVSVKTRLGTKELESVLENLGSAKMLTSLDSSKREMWTGGFFYFDEPASGTRPAPQEIVGKIATALTKRASGEGSAVDSHWPNMLAVGPDLIVQIEREGAKGPQVKAYRCIGLAAGAFVAGLLDHVSSHRSRRPHPLARGLLDCDFELIEPSS